MDAREHFLAQPLAHIVQANGRPLALCRREMAEREKFGHAMPCEDGIKLIPADNEVEVRALAMLLDECAQRIIRVGRSLAPHLQIERTEMGIALHGELGQAQAMFRRRDLPSRLVRRLRCGNEDHLGESQRLARCLRDHQMPNMDGIERAAHDADTLLRLRHDLTSATGCDKHPPVQNKPVAPRGSTEKKDRHSQRRRHAQDDDEDGAQCIVEIMRALVRRKILLQCACAAKKSVHSRTCPSP